MLGIHQRYNEEIGKEKISSLGKEKVRNTLEGKSISSNMVAVLGDNGGHAMGAGLALRGYKVEFYEMPRFADNVKKVLETKTIKITGEVEGVAKL